MAYMKPNDALDTLFVQLQNRLNSAEIAPCEKNYKDKAGQPDTCLSHDWGNRRGRGGPNFYYAPEAGRFVGNHFCRPCAASWYVAVARNLMLGIVG